jgi:hypothetical protein
LGASPLIDVGTKYQLTETLAVLLLLFFSAFPDTVDVVVGRAFFIQEFGGVCV